MNKLIYDDDSYESESNIHVRRKQQQQSIGTKSYDSNNNSSNSNARQRRRDIRTQSSIEAANQITSSNNINELSHSASQDLVIAEIEKKKEGYLTFLS